jgi:hypothetical protein
MNTKLLFVGLAVMLALVGTVSAQNYVPYSGSIQPTISLSLSGTAPTAWNLLIGDNTDSSVTVAAVSNGNWKITAVDGLNDGKPAATAGRMQAWNSIYSPNVNDAIATPMSMKLGGGTFAALSATPLILKTGTAGSFTSTLDAKQTITPTDQVIQAPNVYRIVVDINGQLV